MNKILLCTDGSAFAENLYRYGAWFATRLQAEVDVLCVSDIRTQQAVSTENLSGTIGIDASENLLNHLVKLEHEQAKINHQRAKLVLQAAAQNLKAEGVNQINLLHETGFLVDCLAKFEADCDLVLLGKRGETTSSTSGQLGANLEAVVRSSQKPCLVTSPQFKPIERVLIAYDGSSNCRKIMQFIADSCVFDGLELHIVTVAKSREEPSAIALIEEARQLAQQAGFEPICYLLEGHSEPKLSQYITEQDINLLLMGAYGHNRIRHLVIGSTTAQMFKSSHIPVLLFR
ncbi:UspA domain-containing protein [Stanieria cyanosphaera PCC 7437]|uniref:UspA domain-containing protein n=1 Tax=Stanieria cyanosphaera (strain ATCC 29371 / PCC 7437) TaxID=111780 RepID=K9XPK8_STAC7|nr:universal stress protein [Stanieria cyanosphaera]AFZ34034.1 UspA domain-containing protein [Stanieria cyanosphaera PCC 7437]